MAKWLTWVPYSADHRCRKMQEAIEGGSACFWARLTHAHPEQDPEGKVLDAGNLLQQAPSAQPTGCHAADVVKGDDSDQRQTQSGLET